MASSVAEPRKLHLGRWPTRLLPPEKRLLSHQAGAEFGGPHEVYTASQSMRSLR